MGRQRASRYFSDPGDVVAKACAGCVERRGWGGSEKKAKNGEVLWVGVEKSRRVGKKRREERAKKVKRKMSKKKKKEERKRMVGKKEENIVTWRERWRKKGRSVNVEKQMSEREKRAK